jgi:hypothetical protein
MVSSTSECMATRQYPLPGKRSELVIPGMQIVFTSLESRDLKYRVETKIVPKEGSEKIKKLVRA